MNKVLKRGLIGAGVILVLLCIAYLGMGLYYKGGFPCNIWINGVYCTGKTVSQVNEELLAMNGYDGLAIMDKNGERLFLSAENTDFSIDYTQAIEDVYNNTNPLKWGLYAFENLAVEHDPVISLSKDKVEELISGWDIFIDPKNLKCSIAKDGDGYVLENATVIVPDKQAIVEKAYNAMMNRESVLDLQELDDCYNTYDLRGQNKDKVSLFTKIEKIQNCDIEYNLGDEKIILDKAKASDFILTEKEYEEALEEKKSKKAPGQGFFIINGVETELPEAEDTKVVEGIVTDKDLNPIISESKMYEFFQDVAEAHDTSRMMDNYRQGNSNTIIINNNSKGDGSILDLESEFEYLKERVMFGYADGNEERKFQLSENAEVHDASTELGNTYIEVDMGKQRLYYYVDGILNMDMPVVTGNVNRSRGTPTGIFPVYNKRYHTYLRGADYVSYVNYWLGVHKGVGIHDALWRDEFGEEIYKSDGSHGCINCPIDSVSTLWDVVDIGTPVILYY
jgi:hypothetical protein